MLNNTPSTISTYQNAIVKNAPIRFDVEQIQKSLLERPEIQKFLKNNNIDPSDKGFIEMNIGTFEQYVNELDHPSIPGYLAKLKLVKMASCTTVQLEFAKTNAKILKEAAERASKNFGLLGTTDDSKNASMDSVYKTQDRFRLLKRVRMFLTRYSENQHAKGIYIDGPYGAGKTYIVSAMLHELVTKQNAETLLIFVPNFINSIHQYIQDGTLNKKIAKASTVPVLVLDDLGAEKLSSWVRDEVIGVILNNRMTSNLPTFITSNLSMEKLEEHFTKTKDDFDIIKAQRIMQRVRYLTNREKISGINRRFEEEE